MRWITFKSFLSLRFFLFSIKHHRINPRNRQLIDLISIEGYKWWDNHRNSNSHHSWKLKIDQYIQIGISIYLKQ